jgi:hypothetical protein
MSVMLLGGSALVELTIEMAPSDAATGPVRALTDVHRDALILPGEIPPSM